MCAHLYSSAHNEKGQPAGRPFSLNRSDAATGRPIRCGDRPTTSRLRRSRWRPGRRCPARHRGWWPRCREGLEKSTGLVGRGHLIRIETRFALRHAEHVVAGLTVGVRCGVDDRDYIASTSATAVTTAASEREVVTRRPAVRAVIADRIEAVSDRRESKSMHPTASP